MFWIKDCSCWVTANKIDCSFNLHVYIFHFGMTDSSTVIGKMYTWSANFGLWIHLSALNFSIKEFYWELVEILKL